ERGDLQAEDGEDLSGAQSVFGSEYFDVGQRAIDRHALPVGIDDPDLGDAPAQVFAELPRYVARVVARREDLDRQVGREIAEAHRGLSFRQPFETHERQVG